MDTKKHPSWREAVDRILDRFEAEGYGMIVTHEELLEYLSMRKPDISKLTWDDIKKWDLELLKQRQTTIDRLLEDHSLCLYSIPGKGYEVLHPSEQIGKGFEKHAIKFRRALNKAMSALTNIDSTGLSLEQEQERGQKMKRVAFIAMASRKRKIGILPESKKQISAQ